MLDRLIGTLPHRVQGQLDAWREALEVLGAVKSPRVLASLGPAGVRGLLLQRGKQGRPTRVKASHAVHFDWSYPSDQPGMAELYRRAKAGQWDADSLPWETSVDPLDPEVVLLPDEPYRFTDEDVRELASGPLAGTRARRDDRIVVFDGTLAFWHGPRIAPALDRLLALASD